MLRLAIPVWFRFPVLIMFFNPGTRRYRRTRALEAGTDLRNLQAFLGHVNLNTVAVYTQVEIKALKDLHHAMHPAAGTRPPSGLRSQVLGEATPETVLDAFADGSPEGGRHDPEAN